MGLQHAIAMLVEWLCECQQFATNGSNPLINAQLINKMLHLIIQTWAFPCNIWEWSNLNNTKKFPNIITHLTDVEISWHQLLGMQGPHLQNIHQ